MKGEMVSIYRRFAIVVPLYFIFLVDVVEEEVIIPSSATVLHIV